MQEKQLVLDVHQKPALSKWLFLSFQHVFAMFGATILVPILVNAATGANVLSTPVALISSGVGTLIYIACTKGKSPVYLGSSFVFVTPVAAAYMQAGIAGAMTGIMGVGLVYVICALIIKVAGKEWLHHLLPPVVVGPMIMVIGLGLAPSAIKQVGMHSGATADWLPLLVALAAFLVTVLITVRGRGFIKVIPFLTGIVAGYLTALLLGWVSGRPAVDFGCIAAAPVVGAPGFKIPFVDYALDFTALLTMLPIALVSMAEHIGDHTVLGEIIDRDLLTDPGLDNTLMGDGLATVAAGMLGGPANTTYGENTAVVGMTRIASVWVIGLAAVIAICLGFMAKFIALVSTIPAAVLGGISLLLYGFIASNGLKVLIRYQVDLGDMRNMVITSTMLVLGLGGAVISMTLGEGALLISGMSLAAIAGVLLNLLLPGKK